MAGSLLGPDQVRKINAAFPALVAHIRSLLSTDHTGLGLMRVHCMVETFDSDEMSKLFRELSFISPKEKLALVRAAIYQLMASDPALFIAPEDTKVVEHAAQRRDNIEQTGPKSFTPHQFRLNINKAEDFHGQKAADTPPPAPVVTSTHTSKAAVQLEEGKKQEAAQTQRLDEAVAKLRAQSKPIEIMQAPEDAALPDPLVEE